MPCEFQFMVRHNSPSKFDIFAVHPGGYERESGLRDTKIPKKLFDPYPHCLNTYVVL